MPPRSVPSTAHPPSESYPMAPTGSRRIVAGLLRGLGQALEGWADRLEAAMTQVTATLPNPQVRKDAVAKLWRVWLTIVAQLEKRLPRSLGSVVIGILPIAIVGTVIGLGAGFLVHLSRPPAEMGGTDLTAPPAVSPTTFPQPSEVPPLPWKAPKGSELEESELQDFQRSLLSDDSPPEDFRSDNFRPEDLHNGDGTTGDFSIDSREPKQESLPPQPDIPPLGPPVPDWTTIAVASPFESMVQDKLIHGLSPLLQSLVHHIHINFAQQELTIYLTDHWETLTSVEQHQFVETLRTQARKLDFPHLRFIDKQGTLLARTAIVGQGIIFMPAS